MQIGERQALDEIHCGGVVGFGFTGEAGDDIGSNGRLGEAVVDELDAAGVVLGAVPAVHGGEDAVGGGLQRHVKVLGDAIVGGEQIDQVLGDIERFDGADAEAFHVGFVQDLAKEIFEFDAKREVAAIGAEVDAAEDYFFVAGVGEALDFGDYGWWREAAASSADERDDAIGAARVAAVLDFQSGAGVIPFSAEDGSG